MDVIEEMIHLTQRISQDPLTQNPKTLIHTISAASSLNLLDFRDQNDHILVQKAVLPLRFAFTDSQILTLLHAFTHRPWLSNYNSKVVDMIIGKIGFKLVYFG
jgi:hypothetical protein